MQSCCIKWLLCEKTNSVRHFVLMFKKKNSLSLFVPEANFLLHRVRVLQQWHIVSFVIKPPLWWNYIPLFVYVLVSVEYFSMIISFKLSLSFFIDMEEGKKVGMISSLGKTHSSTFCFLLLPPIPFPCQGCLALSARTVVPRNKTNSSLLPPSLLHFHPLFLIALHRRERN